MTDPSSHPDFWNPRYETGRTPWDLGGVPAALTRYLAARPGRGARALVPGCGSGYEVLALAAAGYRVTAIDFSPPAVARARAMVLGTPGSSPAGIPAEPSGNSMRPDASVHPQHPQIIEGDFFTYDFADAPFDFIYERTFLCALPPELWPKLVARLAVLLKPGGTLAGFYFFGDKEDGPPFGLAPNEPASLFDGPFVTVEDRPVPAEESPSLFAGHERWQERRRAVRSDGG